MFRVQLLGKVGYFEKKEDVYDFAIEQIKKNSFDIILKDLRAGIERVKNDFIRLRVFNSKRLVGRRKVIFKNNLGIQVANYFMNFRYTLSVFKKRSVKENIEDGESLKKVIYKIITLGRINNIKLNSFFTFASLTAGGQKLGQFMPMVAKTVYENWCPKRNARILDISAGFGGRLVGAISSKYNYSYVGVDPSVKACDGLNKLVDFLNVKDRVKIINKPFEDCEDDLKGKFDFCFTSPPYFKKEVYSNEPTQSCNRYPEIGAWQKGFLKKSFKIVFNKLDEGCHMMINIANVKIGGKIYDLEKMTIDTAKEVGFNYIGDKIMEMARMPGIEKKFKSEKIFIFKKL